MARRFRTFVAPVALAMGLLSASPTTPGPVRSVALGEESHGKVAWQDWSEARFAEARRDHRFVLLNMAAVWCHWCHVMDQTTYSDDKVLATLSAHYVSVRVDQDSRPDLSLRYEDWGWPATIVFAADGTEIVKLRGYRNPQVFEKILEAIVADPSPIHYGDDIVDGEAAPVSAIPGATRATLEAGYQSLYDAQNGGWGSFNKLIDPDGMELALTRARADAAAAHQARQTLDAARNLIDPVWGGIYQYSDQVDWKSPHFEKIVSVQAADLRLYSLAYRTFRQPSDRAAATDIYRYLASFLRAPDGAFYVSQDADLDTATNGHVYYALGDGDRRKLGLPRIDTQLYARENGWVISALAAYHDATGDAPALAQAIEAARWVIDHRSRADGGFDHGDADAGGPFLDDTLVMGRAFLDLYRSTADRSWLARASAAADYVLSRFVDPKNGALMSTQGTAGAGTGVAPPVKHKDENVVAARYFNLLAAYTGADRYRRAAEAILGWLASPAVAGHYPYLPGVLLADGELGREPLHVTIIGAKSDPAARDLYAAALRYPFTNLRAEWWDRAEGPLPNMDVDYPDIHGAAAFACSNRICSLPTFDIAGLYGALDRLSQTKP